MRKEFDALYPAPAEQPADASAPPVEPDPATGGGSFLVKVVFEKSGVTLTEGVPGRAESAEGEDAPGRHVQVRHNKDLAKLIGLHSALGRDIPVDLWVGSIEKTFDPSDRVTPIWVESIEDTSDSGGRHAAEDVRPSPSE